MVPLHPCITTQLPAVQTLPAAQGVLSRTFAVVALQTDAPVEQLVTPTLQGFPGVQLVPCVHEQDPLTHPRFVPQLVPSAALVPVSTHT